MPTLYVLTPGLKVSLQSERLRVEAPANCLNTEPPRDVHLHDVELAYISEQVALSFAAVAELIRREIPLIVLSRDERVLGFCHPPSPNNLLRLSQYRRAGEPAFALAVASALVEAKLANSKRVLQRLGANRPSADLGAATSQLERLRREVVTATSVESLRGYEGGAAGAYFGAYGAFFPERCPFERRSRQPPHNAVNAILSFAYTLLNAEIEAQLHAAGFDPAIGFLHEPADRRPSLAFDLLEPFRAPVADSLALDAVSHQALRPQDHFEQRNGGVYLNRPGRSAFFAQYERRMEREFTSEQTDERTSLRREIRRQILSLKQAILDGAVFEPFLMN